MHIYGVKFQEHSASDCEETCGVNFCGSQLILELGSLEVQAGVGHSRFVEDDSEDDCNVSCRLVTIYLFIYLFIFALKLLV